MHKQPQLCKPFIILQIWQPWASYAVSGHMRMLGRGWPGDFEGQIWIVVANKNRDMGSDVAEVEKLYREICQAEKRPFQPIQTFPKQGILGCVEVVACHPAEQLLAWDSLPASRRAEVNAPHCFLVDNAMRLDEPLMCDLASAGRLFFGNRLSCPVDGEPPQCPFSLVAAVSQGHLKMPPAAHDQFSWRDLPFDPALRTAGLPPWPQTEAWTRRFMLANKKKPESIARVLNQQRGLLPPRPLSRSFSLDKRHLLHDLSAEPEEGQHQASAARQGSKRDATDLRRSSSDGGALACASSIAYPPLSGANKAPLHPPPGCAAAHPCPSAHTNVPAPLQKGRQFAMPGSDSRASGACQLPHGLQAQAADVHVGLAKNLTAISAQPTNQPETRKAQLSCAAAVSTHTAPQEAAAPLQSAPGPLETACAAQDTQGFHCYQPTQQSQANSKAAEAAAVKVSPRQPGCTYSAAVRKRPHAAACMASSHRAAPGPAEPAAKPLPTSPVPPLPLHLLRQPGKDLPPTKPTPPAQEAVLPVDDEGQFPSLKKLRMSPLPKNEPRPQNRTASILRLDDSEGQKGVQQQPQAQETSCAAFMHKAAAARAHCDSISSPKIGAKHAPKAFPTTGTAAAPAQRGASKLEGSVLAALTRKLPASKVDWRLDPTAPDTPSSRFIKLGRIAVEAAQRAEHGKAQCSLPAMEAAALGDAGAADRDMPVCTYRVPSIFGDKYHEAESPPSSPKCKTRLFSASNDGTRVGNLQTTQVKLPECQPPQHNHALAPACGDGYDAQKSDAAPTDSLPSKTQLPQAQSSLHQGLKTAAAACAGSPSSPAQSRFADLFELQHDPPASFGGPVWDNSYASCHGDVAMPDVQPCKLTNAAAAASSGSIKRCSSFSFTKLDAYWSAPMRDGFQPQRISSDVSSAQQVDPYSGKISTDTDMLYCEESYGQPGYNSMQEVFPNSSVPESNHALNAISLLSKQLDGCTITEKGGHASAQLHSQAIRSDANGASAISLQHWLNQPAANSFAGSSNAPSMLPPGLFTPPQAPVTLLPGMPELAYDKSMLGYGHVGHMPAPPPESWLRGMGRHVALITAGACPPPCINILPPMHADHSLEPHPTAHQRGPNMGQHQVVPTAQKPACRPCEPRSSLLQQSQSCTASWRPMKQPVMLRPPSWSHMLTTPGQPAQQASATCRRTSSLHTGHDLTAPHHLLKRHSPKLCSSRSCLALPASCCHRPKTSYLATQHSSRRQARHTACARHPRTKMLQSATARGLCTLTARPSICDESVMTFKYCKAKA